LIEEALLTDLEGTMITEESRTITIFSAFFVFITPLLACVLSLIPFLFTLIGVTNLEQSFIFIVGIDLSLIFLFGLAFGGEKRLLKGVRMTVFGVMIFLLGYLFNNLI
jgi:hypothetical protein